MAFLALKINLLNKEFSLWLFNARNVHLPLFTLKIMAVKPVAQLAPSLAQPEEPQWDRPLARLVPSSAVSPGP